MGFGNTILKTLLGILMFACFIALSTCKKKTTAPNSPPTITYFQPSENELVRYIGDKIEFRLLANDSDDDEIQYYFRMDGNNVSNDSSYIWTVNKKGMINMVGIAYNDFADSIEWTISVDNRAPQATNLNLELVEDEPKSVAKESLGIDPDRDNISYSVITKENATFELEVGNITFRGNTDYFGPASIIFEVTDGFLSDTGMVNLNITPVNDYPIIWNLTDTLGNEDEIPIGMVVHDLIGKITDVDDNISSLTLSLEQSNPDLIRLGFNVDSSKIVVDYVQTDGNGSSDILLRVTDPSGLGAELGFTFTVNPMPD